MRLCRCGHSRAVHEHFRGGSDCGICGRAGCPAFRRDWFGWSAARRVIEEAERILQDRP